MNTYKSYNWNMLIFLKCHKTWIIKMAWNYFAIWRMRVWKWKFFALALVVKSTLNYPVIYWNFFFLSHVVQLTGSYFPIRDELVSLAVQVQSSNPWTARELYLLEFLCNHPINVFDQKYLFFWSFYFSLCLLFQLFAGLSS